jgi:hypothetical protein
LLGYILFTSVPFIVLDLYFWDENAIYGVFGILNWGLGFFLLISIMDRAGLFTTGLESGIVLYFLVGFLTGIGTLLGLLALVLPGIYLFVRWFLAYPRALTTTEAVSDSIVWSWHKTGPIKGPLALVMLGPCLLGAGIFFGVPYLGVPEFPGMYELLLIGINLTWSVAMAWLTIVEVAAFSLVLEQSEELATSLG